MRDVDAVQRVSLLLVLGGLAVLFLASTAFVPPRVSVSAVDESMVGERVRVVADVEAVRRHDGTVFLELSSGNTSLEAVAFRELAPVPRAGERYGFGGRVEVYESQLELVVQDVHAVS